MSIHSSSFLRFSVICTCVLFILPQLGLSSDVDKKQACTTGLANYLRLVAGRQESRTEQRLRVHLLTHSGDKASARQHLEDIVDESESTSDLDVQRALLSVQTGKEARKITRDIMKSHRTPSGITQSLAVLKRYSSTKSTKHATVLQMEPYWVPAICSMFSEWGGSWWAVPDHGATALDLLNAGSDHARRLFEHMPTARLVVQTGDSRERAEITLEHFQNVSKSQEWQAKSDWRRRVEAALSFHAGKTNAALRVYEEMINANEARGSAYYRLARLYESLGRQKESEATINAGLSKFPEKNSILLVTAAEYAAKRGEVDEAISLLNKCLAASPEYPPAHILLAELHAQKGNRDAAIKACADTLAFCYGWDGDFLERVDGVLKKLVQQKKNCGGPASSGATFCRSFRGFGV